MSSTPQSVIPVELGYARASVEPAVRLIVDRGRLAITFLYVQAAGTVLSLLLSVVLLAGGGPTLAGANTTWQLISLGIWGLLGLVGFVCAVVFWCRWQLAAYRNLSALGATSLRFTPGWSVGYWFIPILNIFRPFQALCELLYCSSPLTREPTGENARRTPAPGFLQLYWLCWIFSTIVSQIGGRIARSGSASLEPISHLVDIAAGLLALAAAFLATRIIREVNQRQNERFQLVTQQQPA